MPWVRTLAELARSRRNGTFAWALAFALFAAGLAARLSLSPWLEQSPFLTFFPVVAATVLFCGWRQGVMVLTLSAITARYFFLEPTFSFAFMIWTTLIQLISFLVAGASVLVLVEALVQLVQQLDKTARFQENLFQELQHRVANNLQIVAAILQKAQRGIQDPAAIEAIQHARARINSLASLHRRLYDAAAYAQGLEPVLRDVLAETFHALSVTIKLDIHANSLSVGEMTAITLLVNEAAINAAKHVFRPARGTLFEVSLAQIDPGRMQLIVRDDGPGIAPVVAVGPEIQKLGMTVMRSLAAQLSSSLEMPEGPGTTLTVVFPHRSAYSAVPVPSETMPSTDIQALRPR